MSCRPKTTIFGFVSARRYFMDQGGSEGNALQYLTQQMVKWVQRVAEFVSFLLFNLLSFLSHWAFSPVVF